MIMLTSINGREYCLNCDLIYKITEGSDTMITLTNGKVLRVNDKTKEIIEKIISYKRRIHIHLEEEVQ